jgi:Tol biopolymer transport system component
MRIAAMLALLLPAAAALGQVTTRVSVETSGGDPNGASTVPSVSDDGTRVAFVSAATDFVPGDKNGAEDVFVRDLVTGATVRASVDSSGNEVIGTSRFPALSGDGTVVAFESDAKKLVSGDTNGYADVFVHDLVTGVTERVSVDSAGNEANWPCTGASISADGRYVCFRSIATNLVAGDTNGTADVFVHDRVTGVTERVDVDSSGVEANLGGDSGQISEDGNTVVFASSATNLVAGDTNFRVDIFVHDRTTGVTERMSVSTSGAEANLDCSYPTISGDGQIVAFVSQSTNFVAGTTSAASDVFVHDRAAGTTILASHDASGVEGNQSSIVPAASRNGRSVPRSAPRSPSISPIRPVRRPPARSSSASRARRSTGAAATSSCSRRGSSRSPFRPWASSSRPTSRSTSGSTA